jgi:hypothetical protein
MKKLLLLSAIATSFICFGQTNGENINNAGIGGRIKPAMIFSNGDGLDMGSPFFKEAWMKATLVFTNGKSQAGLLVKLDLFENNIHYLDGAGIENINLTPVREVILTDSTSNKEYNFINSSAIAATGVPLGWYELLSKGKASFYKKTIKKLAGAASQKVEDEIKPFNTSTQFYVLTNGNLLQIKRVKDIPEILKDKKKELQEYIRSQKLGGKSESDMINLVEYYNTLK